MKNECFIDFLDAKNNFRKTRKYFKDEKAAQAWAEKNLGKFDPDMVKFTEFEHIY